MAAAGKRGMLLYKIYRAMSYSLTPLIHLHIRWRRLKGLEHPTRWPERLGQPSIPRPSGPLLWFHAVSLGEGMATIPVIRRCVQCRPDLNILMTTTTLSAFEVIKNQLPSGVLYQFSPLDTPAAIDAFLDYWKPNAIMIMENELWPNLIMSSWRKGIPLALLNARISTKSFRSWSQPVLLPLISLMLSKFSLIIPLSNLQAIRFQILQASPSIINFAGDLKYAVEYDASTEEVESIEDLKGQLAHRQVWVAASLHRGEEKVMLEVHKELIQSYPELVTIIVPRYPQHGQEIAQELQKEGEYVALRSQHQRIAPGTHIYVVDTIGELRHLYKLCPIAVIGGSFLPGLAGHNISEASAAGCAVLTGHYVGHFSQMIKKMQQLNPLSVIQVSGALELEEAIVKLFGDAKVLEAHRMAAKQVSCALSSGIVANVWNLLNVRVFGTIFARKK
ncbi:probable 3-deoxy-D-manno-octulosonic acid transferase, mitochondrial [Euphorbia lathyris]|uniref:probable 3-deoxy-D-manno-octulosonic acid transferase, mitochondrial n=1 Tax=Euphorbia lathyris TaxID=212925 RepID=UPI0033139833